MMVVGLGHYLVVSAILLVLGIFGIFLNRKNVIIILMSIELILLAVNLNFVAFSAVHSDLAGQVIHAGVDGRGGGGCHRAGHRRHLLPQSWVDPG